jgi:hypothetical protein
MYIWFFWNCKYFCEDFSQKLIELLEKYNLKEIKITYVKDKGSNLNMMITTLKIYNLWYSRFGGKLSRHLFWACIFQGLLICYNSNIHKVRKRQHQYLGLVIHKVRFFKNPQKIALTFKGGWNLENHQFWWFLNFTLFFFPWVAPFLLHRFSLFLLVQLL